MTDEPGSLAEAFYRAAEAARDRYRMNPHVHVDLRHWPARGRHTACLITGEHSPHKLIRFGREECGGDPAAEPISVRWIR